MRTKRKYLSLFLMLLLLPTLVFAKVDYLVEDQPQVIEQALVLENVGELKQKDNGYLYLDVSDKFISEILPLIECPGQIVPPRHYISKKGIGAHISVMYENERIAHEIWDVEEIGETYNFEITELRSVKIMRDRKMKKLWLIAVNAPDLEEIRINYGLPSKIKGHDFHITLGYQLPSAGAKPVIEVSFEDPEEALLKEAA